MSALEQLKRNEAKEKLSRAHEKVQAFKKKPLLLLAAEAKANPAKLRSDVVDIFEDLIGAMWALAE